MCPGAVGLSSCGHCGSAETAGAAANGRSGDGTQGTRIRKPPPRGSADAGRLVLNLWESEEGSEQAFQDPEIQEARQAMMDSGAAAGPPEITHYEVFDYRPSMG